MPSSVRVEFSPQAKQFLMEEVCLSEPFATQEVDRYSFRAPGQATSYYYGYLKLREVRAQTELALGRKFNARAFHDFVLSQGLLPPEVLPRSTAFYTAVVLPGTLRAKVPDLLCPTRTSR